MKITKSFNKILTIEIERRLNELLDADEEFQYILTKGYNLGNNVVEMIKPESVIENSNDSKRTATILDLLNYLVRTEDEDYPIHLHLLKVYDEKTTLTTEIPVINPAIASH